ncbi:MAG: hypothetical protein ACYCWW_19860 [Deltaproteobacteria bacterium]
MKEAIVILSTLAIATALAWARLPESPARGRGAPSLGETEVVA